MSHQQNDTPATIADPFEFARRGGRIEGVVDAAGLPRLIDMLRSTASQPVGYVVTGESEKSALGEKLFLHVQAGGELVLGCQRCLEELPYVVDVDARLLLVSADEPLPDDELEDDSHDPVHAGRDFDVRQALEEELILALPLAPVHDVCDAPVEAVRDEDASPFAALKSLKRGKPDSQ
ncbi:DUF177 domain-containing protein [Uliginosibacterium sp. sgz301328]|uniref:YceD family protein n=1 Tax=Uliginosibacterium sp. sgz301328 TaxID=3243764 RepID=UPI00359DB624